MRLQDSEQNDKNDKGGSSVKQRSEAHRAITQASQRLASVPLRRPACFSTVQSSGWGAPWWTSSVPSPDRRYHGFGPALATQDAALPRSLWPLTCQLPSVACLSLPVKMGPVKMKPPSSPGTGSGETHMQSPPSSSLCPFTAPGPTTSPPPWPGCPGAGQRALKNTVLPFGTCPLPVLLLSSSSGTCSSPSPAPQSSVPLQRTA